MPQTPPDLPVYGEDGKKKSQKLQRSKEVKDAKPFPYEMYTSAQPKPQVPDQSLSDRNKAPLQPLKKKRVPEPVLTRPLIADQTLGNEEI